MCFDSPIRWNAFISIFVYCNSPETIIKINLVKLKKKIRSICLERNMKNLQNTRLFTAEIRSIRIIKFGVYEERSFEAIYKLLPNPPTPYPVRLAPRYYPRMGDGTVVLRTVKEAREPPAQRRPTQSSHEFNSL